MKKLKKTLAALTLNFIIFGGLVLFLPFVQPAQATSDLFDTLTNQLKPIGEEVYGGEEPEFEIGEAIARVIKIALSLLGAIFIILIIYAGFMWMTSGGNEEKIKKAKETIIAAIIGLAIIVLAYAATFFIIESLVNATD